MKPINPRIVVCYSCGALYDLHYIDNYKISPKKIDKGAITHFECKNCGMVSITIKNKKDFCPKEETLF